nr:HycuOrf-78 hypothetical protein [Hyphantria cunea nucleopolyhedrovirus]UIX56351.1 HycuOrf-78 hypothetical protein [Hyphantria cunea nucleopolyhedrovirus]
MTIPQAALIAVQEKTLSLAGETDIFLLNKAPDTDLETSLTTLMINVNKLTFSGNTQESLQYNWLKANITNCINILIDLIILKKYV